MSHWSPYTVSFFGPWAHHGWGIRTFATMLEEGKVHAMTLCMFSRWLTQEEIRSDCCVLGGAIAIRIGAVITDRPARGGSSGACNSPEAGRDGRAD